MELVFRSSDSRIVRSAPTSLRPLSIWFLPVMCGVTHTRTHDTRTLMRRKPRRPTLLAAVGGGVPASKLPALVEIKMRHTSLLRKVV